MFAVSSRNFFKLAANGVSSRLSQSVSQQMLPELKSKAQLASARTRSVISGLFNAALKSLKGNPPQQTPVDYSPLSKGDPLGLRHPLHKPDTIAASPYSPLTSSLNLNFPNLAKELSELRPVAPNDR